MKLIVIIMSVIWASSAWAVCDDGGRLNGSQWGGELKDWQKKALEKPLVIRMR